VGMDVFGYRSTRLTYRVLCDPDALLPQESKVEMVVKKLGRALDEKDVDDAEAALTLIQQWGLKKQLSRDQSLLRRRVKLWVKQTKLESTPASAEADDDDDDVEEEEEEEEDADDDDAMLHPALRRTAPSFDEPDSRVTTAVSSDEAWGTVPQLQSGERSTYGLGGVQQSATRVSDGSEAPLARGGGERSIGEVAGRIKRANTNPNRWFKPEAEEADKGHADEEKEEEEEGEVGSTMDEAAVRQFMAVAEAQEDIEAVEALMKSQQRRACPHWTAEDDKVRLREDVRRFQSQL